MENDQNSGNAGEQENKADMGLPEKTHEFSKENPDSGRSLPSDGPFSQSEVSDAGDLTEGLENDDPKDIRHDADTGG